MSFSPIKKVVIPAAGYGTRFLPITKVVPKELLPIGNKPAIHYVVEEAVALGAEEIILVCHPSKAELIDYFRPNQELRRFLEKRGKKDELLELEKIESMARFQVVYQEEPLGLGHAVWCAREALAGESFWVTLPDVLMPDGVKTIGRLRESCVKDGDWGLLVKKVRAEDVRHYGIIKGWEIDQTVYRIDGAIEKPTVQQAPSHLSILGRYLLPPDILEILDGLKQGVAGEIQLTDAIDALARQRPGQAIVVEEKTFDTGTPEGLREAAKFYERVLP